MKSEPVYLDYNAGAPLRLSVLEMMREWSGQAANPSSIHAFGRRARGLVETARERVAALVGAVPEQVIFNSGATEGNNTVLSAFSGRRILVSAIEHPSILEGAPQAERFPVTSEGVVDLEALDSLLRTGPPPALICVMMVNNETGVIQPVEEIVRLARRCNAAVHVDAAQAVGRIPVDMARIGVDTLAVSAHKIGGLSGAGALVLGNCAPPPVLLRGGGQEQRARAGTENVAGISGFGLAAKDALEGLESYSRIGTLRDHLERRISLMAPSVRFFGQKVSRVANTSLFAVPGILSRTALIHLDLAGVAISSGSACSSGVVKPSPVLLAMGQSEETASCALRVSAGWDTTGEDIERFVRAFEQMVTQIGQKGA